MPITITEIRKQDGGAQFYAADLHVHSFGASADVRDERMTVEAIIDTAHAQGLALLSITDHNTVANVERALDYAGKYSGQVLVLPGVEVSTAHGHVLIYFAPENVGALHDFIGRIGIVGRRGGRDSHTTMSMTDVIRVAEQLKGVAIAAHIDRADAAGIGFEMREAGYPTWKGDIITSSGLYGLEFDKREHLAWYSPEDGEPARGAERMKLLRRRDESTATAARVRLAAVQSSDAHSLDAFVEQITQRSLTRLKMDELTFDGFRTALIDPGARVRAVATLPPAVPRILGMHVQGGFLDGQTCHFSPNLNCFIGGRGTGKSTALRSLAYGLGLDDDFEDYGNCPDQVVVYCEDANGILYRYERHRGSEPAVRAREDGSVHDVPPDAFRIELYGQGALAEVAKDPLRNAQLLQEFLDEHIVLGDLRDRETGVVAELEQNSASLKPLEVAASQLGAKRATLEGLNKKLRIAETGKVKEIAALQARVSAEKNLVSSLEEVKTFYERGLSLAVGMKNFDALAEVAGPVTDDATAVTALGDAKAAIDRANRFLTESQAAIQTGLKEAGRAIGAALSRLRKRHSEIERDVAAAIEKLQRQGLSGSVAELGTLLTQQTRASAEVARIVGQTRSLDELRATRVQLLEALAVVRAEITERRKAQLRTVNKNLAHTISDYVVVLRYDLSGIVEGFQGLVLDVMHGSHFPEEAASRLCAATTPVELAEHVRSSDVGAIAQLGEIGERWAQEFVGRFRVIENLHRLEVMDKPPRPVIRVLTKARPPKAIPVTQLSDGQKHTILLTIAILADSNVPLLIDQPEDDLDNAFIFSSVVRTLRDIKERRQVLLVTHNANIAVLGDSELLLPMRQSDNKGHIYERGSIDRGDTCRVVQDILEGGVIAFRQRKEIYGH